MAAKIVRPEELKEIERGNETRLQSGEVDARTIARLIGEVRRLRRALISARERGGNWNAYKTIGRQLGLENDEAHTSE